MHSRHRSPGNGYSPMGMKGISAPSRIAPESSTRGGHGMFNPEYRNYGHGFGRGHPRPSPTQGVPPIPQHRPDIFSEAGRLATEYLVSRGLLPQDVLTGKWQNGSLKKLMQDFRGSRQQEGDSLPHHHSRNGSDLVSGRRRQSDEYRKPDGSKIHSRDKSRSKSSGSDFGREMHRSSSLSEKARSNSDLGERGIDSEASTVGQLSCQSRDVKTSDVTGESQSTVDNFHNSDGMVGDGKDLRAETDAELPKTVDDVKPLDGETGDPKDSNSCQVENLSGEEDTPMHDCAAGEEPVKHSSDNLLNVCSFSKEPTKTPSMKDSKGDLVSITEEEKGVTVSQPNNCGDGPLAGSDVVYKDVSVDDSSVIETPNQVLGSKCADLDSVKQRPDAGELDQMDTDQGKDTGSQFLSLGSFMGEHKDNEGYFGVGRCSSMIIERGEKRTAEYINDEAIVKKPRESSPIGVTQMPEYPHSSQSALIQDQPAVEKVGPATGGASMLHKNGVGAIEYTEEMQFFPGSFKICDLNTVEASQQNEISVPDSTILLPSITVSKNEVDLSTNNNRGLSATHTRRGADGKEIEVIDLDDDCLQVDNVFESSERKEDTVFMGSENFPDHAQIVNDISRVQDGYDLMMSDFLGNDITSSGNVNSLQNDVALDNGEGILGDDESIYMSLGEIPISFLGVWERSTQDFDNKPF